MNIIENETRPPHPRCQNCGEKIIPVFARTDDTVVWAHENHADDIDCPGVPKPTPGHLERIPYSYTGERCVDCHAPQVWHQNSRSRVCVHDSECKFILDEDLDSEYELHELDGPSTQERT